MNKQLLQLLAGRTGGMYFDAQNFAQLAEMVKQLPNFQSRELVNKDDIDLWNLAWTLGLAIAIFSLEWLLRKRNGML